MLDKFLAAIDGLSTLLEYLLEAAAVYAQTPQGKAKLAAILRDLQDEDSTPESREAPLTPPPVREDLDSSMPLDEGIAVKYAKAVQDGDLTLQEATALATSEYAAQAKRIAEMAATQKPLKGVTP